VGDISDEYDRELRDVVDLGDGHYRVSARLATDELGDLYGIDLDDDDVDSVGGLMGKALGRLPLRGDTVVVSGLKLTADRVERRRLLAVTVEATPDLLAFQERRRAERAEVEHRD
jgi:Mg2+/Co2+ transporter CorC